MYIQDVVILPILLVHSSYPGILSAIIANNTKQVLDIKARWSTEGIMAGTGKGRAALLVVRTPFTRWLVTVGEA